MISNLSIRSYLRLLALNNRVSSLFATAPRPPDQQSKNQMASLNNRGNSLSATAPSPPDKQSKKQMALAAAECIRFILSCPLMDGQQLILLQEQNLRTVTKEQAKLPLSDLIIQHLTRSAIKPETINTFRDILDPRKGVTLPQHLKTQDRVKDASKNNAKMAFCPNRLVTVPIFKIINDIQKKTLVYGSIGISKTISFIFYSYLSQFITNYDMQYDDFEAKDIPRLLYFSYYNKQSSLEIHTKNVIKYLRSHFPSTILKKINSNNTSRRDLDKVYDQLEIICREKGIEYKVIIDQFNTFAAECREFNRKVDKKKELNDKLQTQRQYLINKKNLWFYSTNSFTKKRYIFNSSYNVEDQVIGRQFEPKIGFDLHHHSEANVHKIDFFKLKHSSEAHQQMVHFLFFELQKKFTDQHKAKTIQKIKQAFYEQDYNKLDIKGETLMTPLTIRKFFVQNKIDQSLEELIKEDNKTQVLRKIIKAIQQKNIQIALESLKKFCSQGTETIVKEKLMLLLDLRSIIKNRTEQIKKQNLQLKKKQQIQLIDAQQLTNKSFLVHLRSQNIDRNLFELIENDFNRSHIQKVRLKYSAEDFMKITSFIPRQILSYLLTHQDISWLQKVSNSGKGSVLDTVVVDILRQSPVRLSFQKNNSHISLVTQKAAREFQHFNQRKQQKIPDLSTRFRKMLNQLKIEDVQTVSGVPMTMEGQRSDNSESIDFIMIKNISDDLITVYSFDLTLLSATITQTSNSGKLTTSIRKIQEILKRRYEIQVQNEVPKIMEWNHVILCRPQKYQEISIKVSKKGIKRRVLGVNYTKVSCFTSDITRFKLKPQGEQYLKQKIVVKYFQILQFLKKLLIDETQKKKKK